MSVCTTCLQPGIPADGQHDCPGIGEIQVSRHRGRGVVVDAAPARALIGLRIIRDLAWPANIAEVGDPDLVNIADQVLYRVTGYDPETAALVVELVEDWRPKPTDTISSLPQHELHATIRKMARADPAWFRAAVRAMDRTGRAANAHAALGEPASLRGTEDAADNAEDRLRRTRIELEHWQTSIVPELRAERDQSRAVLDRVRALETRLWEATDGRTMPVSAVCHSIANDLRAALNPPPEEDNPPVQCWHTEPDTPCDWNTCRQPERLAAGDRGTDPARKERP